MSGHIKWKDSILTDTVEDRGTVADTHLALLGVKIAGPAFWGVTEEKFFRGQKNCMKNKRDFVRNKGIL